MRVKIMCLLIVFCCFSFAAYAEDQERTNRKISFNEYIEIIKHSLPDIEVIKADQLSAENKVLGAESAGDIELKAGGSGFTGREYPGQGITSSSDLKSYNYYAGISKTFVPTGTSVSTTYTYTVNKYGENDSIPGYSEYQPLAVIRISQPLLYNFLGTVDKYSRNNAKMELEIAKQRVQQNSRSVLNAYKKLYFQWIVYRDYIDNMDEAVSNSKALSERIRYKLKSGLADNDDYQSSVASVLNFENQRTAYQTYLRGIENQLKVYFNINEFSPDSASFDVYINKVLHGKLDVVDFHKTTASGIMKLTMDNYLYSVGVYKNKLLPEFNLYTEITRKSYSDSYSSDMHDSDYILGFEFKYLIGNSSAKSELREKEIQLEAIRSEYMSAEKKYQKDILVCLSLIEGITEQLLNKERLLKVLESQHLTEVKKYNQGRLSLSFVIETENTIAAEKSNILSLKYELIGNYLDYLDLIQ